MQGRLATEHPPRAWAARPTLEHTWRRVDMTLQRMYVCHHWFAFSLRDKVMFISVSQKSRSAQTRFLWSKSGKRLSNRTTAVARAGSRNK